MDRNLTLGIAGSFKFKQGDMLRRYVGEDWTKAKSGSKVANRLAKYILDIDVGSPLALSS
jgi:hypothetical protein